MVCESFPPHCSPLRRSCTFSQAPKFQLLLPPGLSNLTCLPGGIFLPHSQSKVIPHLPDIFFLTILKRSFTKPLSWYPVMKKDVEIVWSRHMSKQRPWEAIAYLKDPFVTGSLVPPGVTWHTTVTTGVEESGAWGPAAWRSEYGAQRAEKPAALGIHAHRWSLHSAFSSLHM